MDEEKKKKYDRQLRLWGEHGQARLGDARVCLFTADATGTEILKNIILPAVGSFTIVDGQMVELADLGSSFFVTRDSVGKPRAQVTLELLCEMNDEVKGDCLVESPASMIRSPSITEMLSAYTAVVATQLDAESRQLLAATCWQLNIPLFLVQTNGMVGTLRCQFKEHTVIESKPETNSYDLRLSMPFSELLQFASETDLAGLDDEHHSHVPWVIIVIQLVNQFRQENDGNLPKFGDRAWFESALKAMQRVPDQQNLVQAKAGLRSALMPVVRTLSDEAREVLDDAVIQNNQNPSSSFWVVAHAIKDFLDGHEGLPPLAGRIPDMVSDNASYIRLQTLYKAKCEEDVATVLQRAQEILQETGQPADTVSAQQVRLMCLNTNCLRVIRTDPVEADKQMLKLNEKLTSWDPADAESIWILLFMAVDKFHEAHARFPGGALGSYAEDVPLLKVCLQTTITELQLAESIQGWKTAHPDIDLDDLINECCRFGNSQLHPVAAVMGGVVSQEVLKVVTEQFTPLSNWLVYNAIKSTTMCM